MANVNVTDEKKKPGEATANSPMDAATMATSSASDPGTSTAAQTAGAQADAAAAPGAATPPDWKQRLGAAAATAAFSDAAPPGTHAASPDGKADDAQTAASGVQADWRARLGATSTPTVSTITGRPTSPSETDSGADWRSKLGQSNAQTPAREDSRLQRPADDSSISSLATTTKSPATSLAGTSIAADKLRGTPPSPADFALAQQRAGAAQRQRDLGAMAPSQLPYSPDATAAASNPMPSATTAAKALFRTTPLPAAAPAKSFSWAADPDQPTAAPAAAPPASAAAPSVAASPLAAAATSTAGQQPFKAQLANGITYQAGNTPGSRVFTMGTPGQDGYGKLIAHGTTYTDGGAQPTRTMEALGYAPVPGYSFQGSAADAARFNRPVSSGQARGGVTPGYDGPSPIDLSHQAWLEHSGKAQPAGPQMPQYLGKDSGLGWKTRLGLYKEQMGAYNHAMGQQNALDIEAMREAGAGRRALLNAQGVNDANAIARQRLGGDLALNAAKIGSEQLSQQGQQFSLDAQQRLADVQQRYMAEADPVKRKELSRTMQALMGKEQSKYQIVNHKGTDPNNPLVQTETSYVVNPDNPTETWAIGGQQPLPLPKSRDVKDLRAGATYVNRNGHVAVWTGDGFSAMNGNEKLGFRSPAK